MMSTRPTAFVTSIGLVVSVYLQLFQLCAPMLTTKANASSWNRGLSVTMLLFGGMTSSCLFSLVPTLRLEKKIGNRTALAIIFITGSITGLFDGYRYSATLKTLFANRLEFLATSSEIMSLLNGSGINEIMFVGTLFTIVNAIRRRSHKKMIGRGAHMTNRRM